MAIIREPVDIFVEFLRAEYKEPARSGLSKRHTTTSQTFSGDGSTKTFTVSNTKLLCVNSVSISSVAKTKYLDYDIDLKNSQIVFVTAPASGSNNISVSYDYSTTGVSWINPDSPRENLARTNYPRIGVVALTESGEFLGMFDNDQWDSAVFQLDVVTKKELIATDYVRVKSDGTTETITENREGQELVNELSRGVINAIKRNWRDEISHRMHYFEKINSHPVPYESDRDVFRQVIEYRVKGFDMGETS